MDSKEKARVENRCAFLKTEIKKYKDHIAFTEKFLEDAENELDSLVNELVEAEDGNGGVVYTYGQNTPLIDKVVKELCDRLPNDIF